MRYLCFSFEMMTIGGAIFCFGEGWPLVRTEFWFVKDLTLMKDCSGVSSVDCDLK